MPLPHVRRIRFLDGPSLYASGPCGVVDLDGEMPAAPIPSHPMLAAAGLPPPPDAAAAIAWLGTALQRALRHPAPMATASADRAVVPVWDADVGARAVQAATTAVSLAAAADGSAAVAAIDGFFAGAPGLDHSDGARGVLLRAAARGIPWARLLPGHAALRLGQGVRQRTLLSAYTQRTSYLATQVATQKDQASALLRRQGLPAPPNGRAHTVAQALQLAAAIGFPVVVKPVATDFGTAVSVGIKDEAGLRRAYAAAARHGPVLVERQIAGDHVRLLVMNGRFVSAVRQDPAAVTGDGMATVRELVDRVNAGRTAALSSSFKRILLDDEADALLAARGLDRDGVPAAGQPVVLRHTSNTSRGGTARNVTAEVHPDNRRLAERAAAVVGLDVAGVDFITPDVARSFREVGGGICEINPGPGLYMREADGVVEDALLDGLFPAGGTGRVPVVCLLARAGPGAAGAFERLARRMARDVAGLAVVRPGAARIGDWPLAVSAPVAGARLALADPECGALLVHLTRASVAADGLPFDACDLALIAPGAGADDPVAALLAGVARRTVDAGDAASVLAAVAALVAESSPDGL